MTGRSVGERPFEPSISIRRHAVLTPTPMEFQVLRCFGRDDEAEVPGILCCALEPVLVEADAASENSIRKRRRDSKVVLVRGPDRPPSTNSSSDAPTHAGNVSLRPCGTVTSIRIRAAILRRP